MFNILLFLAFLPVQATKNVTVLDGVYTAEQAVRGEATFMEHCQSCHSYASLGGPEALSLKGNRFMEAWREDSLENLFAKMRRTMPQQGPKLEDHEYVDVITFLLSANGLPAGTAELNAEQLAGIQLVGKDGPRPLPSSAVVKAVGCFTPGAGDTWTLTNATDVVRTREPNQSTTAELKASGDAPLGTQTFLLRGFDNLEGFTPDSLKGRKAQVKGVLFRQQSGNRINVTSAEPVGGSCGQ